MPNRRSILKIWAAIVLFISGYIPLFVIMLIKDLKEPGYCEFKNFTVSLFLLFIIMASGIFLYKIMKSLSGEGGFSIKVISVKSKSSEIVNYTIPYMISFFAFDMSKPTDLVVFLIFFVMLCALSISSQSIFINPILAIFGYGLYECKYIENSIEKEEIVLSRIDITQKRSYEIKRLSNYLSIISKYPEED